MRICNDAGKCNFIIWMLEDTELGNQMKVRYFLWYDTRKKTWHEIINYWKGLSHSLQNLLKYK